MTKQLRVMVGVPGSGKSTWLKKRVECLEADGFHVAVISRDEIRKSFIGENEDYFSHEIEVFDEFIRQINEAMEIGFDYVFVDATHISRGSRAKLLGRLRPDPSTDLVFEVIECGLATCLARNAKRTGFARVPDSAIHKMYRGYKSPTLQEFANTQYGFRGVAIHHYNTEEEEGNK